AYELVLAPKDTRSLVGQVRIAVDAEHSVPLRVQVIAKGATQPAFEVGFTQVSFATPGDEQFRFVPPKGATLDTGSGEPGSGERRPLPDPAGPGKRRFAPGDRPTEPGVAGKLPARDLPAVPGKQQPAPGDRPTAAGKLPGHDLP